MSDIWWLICTILDIIYVEKIKLNSSEFLFQKLHTRRKACAQMANWSEVKRTRVEKALEFEFMSSGSDAASGDEDIFIAKPLRWRSDEYSSLLKELDKKREKMKTKRGRRQTVKRRTGDTFSDRPAPEDISVENQWVLADQR